MVLVINDQKSTLSSPRTGLARAALSIDSEHLDSSNWMKINEEREKGKMGKHEGAEDESVVTKVSVGKIKRKGILSGEN